MSPALPQQEFYCLQYSYIWRRCLHFDAQNQNSNHSNHTSTMNQQSCIWKELNSWIFRSINSIQCRYLRNLNDTLFFTKRMKYFLVSIRLIQSLIPLRLHTSLPLLWCDLGAKETHLEAQTTSCVKFDRIPISVRCFRLLFSEHARPDVQLLISKLSSWPFF
jgi:hypothetical protein